MSTPYLGEIRVFAFSFAPTGWLPCSGQTLAISQYAALFAILGTTYGGNGTSTFQLPNLQGRMPVHFGNGFLLGQVGGEATHTLITSEMPQHTHQVYASSTLANVGVPTGNLWATGNAAYNPGPTNTFMNPACIPNAGGSQPHDNMSPYLVLNFCIAISGIFPTSS
jgi:microcystin-dependent protein